MLQLRTSRLCNLQNQRKEGIARAKRRGFGMNFGLPPRTAGYSFEWPSQIVGDPPAIEAARLWFDSLGIDIAIEEAGVESKVMANFLEVGLRKGVRPSCIFSR